MLLLLNQEFSAPTGCIVLVHKLMEQARSVKEMRASHPQLFQGALSEQDLKKKDQAAEDLKARVVNEFLQQNVLLMQRQPQLVPSLLRVLANLAGVMEGNLGARCLEALQDVMGAGEGYKDVVVENSVSLVRHCISLCGSGLRWYVAATEERSQEIIVFGTASSFPLTGKRKIS